MSSDTRESNIVEDVYSRNVNISGHKYLNIATLYYRKNMINLQDCYPCQQEASHHLLEKANCGRHKLPPGILTICLHLVQDMLPDIHKNK